MKTNRPAFQIGCLIVASMMLGGTPATVRAQAPAGASTNAAVISSVAITQAPQRAAIRVEGAGKLDVHAARMQNPERLVLDFASATMGVQKSSIPGVSAPVRSVRLGQFRPDIARVVIDLTTAAPYQIAHEGEAVVIYFTTEEQPVEASPVNSAATREDASRYFLRRRHATEQGKQASHRGCAAVRAAQRFDATDDGVGLAEGQSGASASGRCAASGTTGRTTGE